MMRRAEIYIIFALMLLFLAGAANAQMTAGNFESGGFEGWTADPAWVVVDNDCGFYAGWHGKYWAWSGGKGEAAVGKLKSKLFVLDKDGVRMMISGWSSIFGTGNPRKWNYITLNLADGTEIDRIYAPNTTNFVSVFLNGSKYKGKKVYIEAVDDADQASFSMLCIDDVYTASIPVYLTKNAPPYPRLDPKQTIKLEDKEYLVAVDKLHGRIVRILDKKTGLDLIREPRLAGNFRFSLPLPGKEPWQWLEANYIFGANQKLSSYKKTDRQLTLNWNGPMKSNLGGSYHLSVVMNIELAKDAGIVFSLKVNNTTPYQVGEAYFPVLGGLQGLGKTVWQLKSTEFVKPSQSGAASSDIFRVFNNMTAFGDVGPEQFYTYPKDMPEPWVEFYSPKLDRSCFICAIDEKDRSKVVHLELSPSSSGPSREDGNWPRPAELNGLPVGVIFGFVEFANSPARKIYEPSPVMIRFHDGGWSEGKKVFEEWKGRQGNVMGEK